MFLGEIVGPLVQAVNYTALSGVERTSIAFETSRDLYEAMGRENRVMDELDATATRWRCPPESWLGK